MLSGVICRGVTLDAERLDNGGMSPFVATRAIWRPPLLRTTDIIQPTAVGDYALGRPIVCPGRRDLPYRSACIFLRQRL